MKLRTVQFVDRDGDIFEVVYRPMNFATPVVWAWVHISINTTSIALRQYNEWEAARHVKSWQELIDLLPMHVMDKGIMVVGEVPV